MNLSPNAFVLTLNLYEPSSSASHWLSIAVFQNEKKLKIGGVIKNLRGKELKKKHPSSLHPSSF